MIAIIVRVRPLSDAIERKDRDLSSQLKRALNNVALNVARPLALTPPLPSRLGVERLWDTYFTVSPPGKTSQST